MLSCTSYQCVRSLKPGRTFTLHFPLLLRKRSNNEHTPLAGPVAQNVFNDRLHFPPDRVISGVMKLDQHRHFLSILQREFRGCGATRLCLALLFFALATPERRNSGKMSAKSLGLFAV